MDIYQELGVPGFINARGPYTRFGGAILPPLFVEAMAAAARSGTIGADAVMVSGGNGLRGPQSSGVVFGTQAMINGCAYHGVPNVRIGRGMKVGAEKLRQFFLQGLGAAS